LPQSEDTDNKPSVETAATMIMTHDSNSISTTKQQPTKQQHQQHIQTTPKSNSSSNNNNNNNNGTKKDNAKTKKKERATLHWRYDHGGGPAPGQMGAESSSFLKNRAGSASFLNNLTEEGQARMKLMDGQGSGGV
jgi:hypothetical protein